MKDRFRGAVFSYTNDLKDNVIMAQNVCMNVDGTISRLPFYGGQGWWYFDGQIYSKKSNR